MHSNKAPGPLGITAEMTKALDDLEWTGFTQYSTVS